MQSFLIQYLRKSKLACSSSDLNKLGDYLNFILRNIISSLEDEDSIDIYIRGACWSKKEETAGELIDVVFKGLNEYNYKVYLCNQYRGCKAKETDKACKNRKINSTIASVKSDHSKEILIKKDNKVLFYMVGSSNFSKTTYLGSPNINQSEVAFIKFDSLTRMLINKIMLYSENNEMLIKWLKINDEINDEIKYEINDEINKIFKNIITAPYYSENNEDDFFNNIYNELIEVIEKDTEDTKDDTEDIKNYVGIQNDIKYILNIIIEKLKTNKNEPILDKKIKALEREIKRKELKNIEKIKDILDDLELLSKSFNLEIINYDIYRLKKSLNKLYKNDIF